ncbi:hypothetical protein NEAUS06_1106 [Nematocida ausubeli]|nr:hypothetical protein NEAUS06_1106 [Nematocida ausubeli]
MFKYIADMKFLAGFLKGKCMQCLDSDYRNIVAICSCGAELCRKHAVFHIFEKHTQYPIEIIKENEKMYAQITTNDCFLIEGSLEVLKCKCLAACLIKKESVVPPCMHIFKVFKEMNRVANQISRMTIDYEESECCLCSLRKNRWLCIVCGLVFCGRQRYDMKGNSHAYKHFEGTEHSIFINLDDFDPSHLQMAAFCCYCGVFIIDEIIYEIFNCRYIGVSGCGICPGNSLNKSNKKNCSICSQKSTCMSLLKSPERSSGYALAVLHGISYAILSVGSMCIFNNMKIRDANTEFKNMVNEMLAKMIYMHVFGKNEYIFIDQIEHAINSEFVRYEEDALVDVARFFRNCMSMLKRNERPDCEEKNISNLFYILLRSSITCNVCREKWDRSEKVCILYLKPNQSISEFFSIKQLDKLCKCGAANKTVTSCLANIPSIITIRLKKPGNYILGENATSTIEKELCIPYRESERRSEHAQVYPQRVFENRMDEEENLHDIGSVFISDLLPPDVFEKMKMFFVKNQTRSQKRPKSMFQQGRKESFLSYKLKAAVIYQNNPSGGYYFAQMLDERSFLNNHDADIEKVLWTTFIDGKIDQLPLFKDDAILLLYVNADE